MTQQNDTGSIDTHSAFPWWVSLAAGAVAYPVLVYLVPPLSVPGLLGNAAGPIAKGAAPYVAAALVLCGPILWFRQRRRIRAADSERDLDSLRARPWPEFARLIGEAFRQKGFSVEERSGADADGNVDLILRRGGAVTVVQCNRWREPRVGVEPIRELYGAMTGEDASGALFITSGRFTAEAAAFAQTKPIGLIDGPALLELVQEVQSAADNQALDGGPTCHVCSRPMVQRIERHGLRREVFWACSGYPHCKGNRPLQEAA
jgi:restriction system protein